ncbi:DNA binding protein [Aureococcus anophagefferens]|nr:DNA binding protein [Aureococcus anophagefferens]
MFTARPHGRRSPARLLAPLVLLAASAASDERDDDGCGGAASCWADDGVAPFDCEASPYPLQVLKWGDDAESYNVRQLDIDTGDYALVFTLDYFDDHVNAAALYEDADGAYYAFASMGGLLCRFDAERRACFDEPLEYAANVGCVVGDRYYYSKNTGRNDGSAIFYVDDVQTASPKFHNASSFTISASLYEDAVLDLAPLPEDGAVYVDDGVADATYLVGLAARYEVLVVRLSSATGAPEAYAVLPSTVDWSDYPADDPPDGADSSFGAAFAYVSETAGRELYFASNEGYGIFFLELPLDAPADCWNAGHDVESHVVCDGAAAVIRWVGPSLPASSNDGLNCPEGSVLQETEAPSYAPSTYAPSATPADVSARASDDEPYEAAMLDFETGNYETLYAFDFDGHINAVAMHADASYSTFTAWGSFAGFLCKFDSAHRKCFPTPLAEEKPNLGTILEDTYYCAKEVGDNGEKSFYFVSGIDTEAPAFHEDALFVVSEDVFERSVLDIVALTENFVDAEGVAWPREFVADGDDAGRYLFGMGQALEVVVVRLDDGGVPDAYAVLPAVVDWNGADVETGTSAYGAAFLYQLDMAGDVEMYFAANEGFGLFQVVLPVTVPDACWNTGFGGVAARVRFFQPRPSCASTASRRRRPTTA